MANDFALSPSRFLSLSISLSPSLTLDRLSTSRCPLEGPGSCNLRLAPKNVSHLVLNIKNKRIFVIGEAEKVRESERASQPRPSVPWHRKMVSSLPPRETSVCYTVERTLASEPEKFRLIAPWLPVAPNQPEPADSTFRMTYSGL